MIIKKENITIRSANVYDAKTILNWWNDGKVMEHAGFPKGLGTNLESVTNNILNNLKDNFQLMIIEIDGIAVGETSYNIKDKVPEIGIKICEEDYQNKGYGPKIIKMLLNYLFSNKKLNSDGEINKVIWDTNQENIRAQHVYENKIKARKVSTFYDAWVDQNGNPKTSINYVITRDEFYKFHEEYLEDVKLNTKKIEEHEKDIIEVVPYSSKLHAKEVFETVFSGKNTNWQKWDGPYFNDECKVFTCFEEYLGSKEEKYYEKGNLNLIICNGKIVGDVSKHWENEDTRWLEIGIIIFDDNNWTTGIGSKALTLWIDKIFNEIKNLEHIGLTTWSGNIPMIKSAQKIGLVKEGQIRKVRYYNDFYYDSMKFGVTREEWFQNK